MWITPISAAVVSIESPADGSIVVGPTEFRVAVEAGAAIDRVDLYVDGQLIGTVRAPGWSLEWTPPTTLTAATLLAVAYRGEEVVEQTKIRTSDAVFAEAMTVEEVQVYPVVQDRQGRYVRGLEADDFRVLDGSVPAQVTSFSAEPAALTVGILLDSSRSMAGKLSALQEAACRFVDRLGEDDRVSVYSFNHTFRVVSENSGQREQVKAGIRSLAPFGGTALYDSVIRALENLDQVAGRKTLIIFSDGRDERSFQPLQQAVDAARRADIVLYAIGVEETDGAGEARTDLISLAEKTGGEAHFLAKFSRLVSAFDDILADIRAQYYLTLVPHPGPAGTRPLRVEVAGERRLRVRARESYEFRGSEPTPAPR